MNFEFVQGENLIENLDKEIELVAQDLVQTLKEKAMHIAIAESCTGGLVAKTVTDVAGASNVFECGIVSYSCGIKEKLLSVDKALLDTEGPISPDTAAQMAEGVRKLGNADIAISTTGVAGPGPDGCHLEGEIYIALSNGKNVFVMKLETKTKNQREQNRKIATYNALKIATDYLKGGMTNG